MPELHDLTALQAAALLAAGEISSVELTRSCLDWIARRDGSVGAWCQLNPELALRQASAADATERRSRFHGVPFGAKDIIDTVDFATELGSRAHVGRRPQRDAACITKMREAGAVLLGKLVTTEYAMFSPNGTRHPLDPARTPGGSSSGTAAAVADRQVPIGFGTQTAGSLIRPAAFCGVFGFKPTHGAVSLEGVQPLAPFLDTIGCMARSVEDLQAQFEIIAGVGSSRWQGACPPRIGLCRTDQWKWAQPEARQVLERIASQLSDLGWEVREFALPARYADLISVHRTILCRGVVENLAAYYEAGPVSDSLAGIIAEGLALSTENYASQRAVAEDRRAAINDDLAGYDGLLCPSAPGEAPIGWQTGDPVFQMIWTLLGVPCLNLPLGSGPHGLPVGIQLIGRRNEDARLLELAAMISDSIKSVDLAAAAGAS